MQPLEAFDNVAVQAALVLLKVILPCITPQTPNAPTQPINTENILQCTQSLSGPIKNIHQNWRIIFFFFLNRKWTIPLMSNKSTMLCWINNAQMDDTVGYSRWFINAVHLVSSNHLVVFLIGNKISSIKNKRRWGSRTTGLILQKKKKHFVKSIF